jgi:cobalamin biosynthesis Mg chelatase CobN
MQKTMNALSATNFLGWSYQAQKLFFCALLFTSILNVAPVKAQEADLIKERISLAPGQKRTLEKYDAPGKDNKESESAARNNRNSVPEKLASFSARNLSKETGNKERSSQANSLASASTSSPAAAVAPSATPFYSAATNANSSTSTGLAPATSGYTNFSSNPEKSLGNGMEYLAIIVFLFLAFFMMMNKFRPRTEE